MPYLLDISSRVIESVDQVPGDIEDWTVSKFHIKRLLNDQHPHELEWEDVTIGGLLNEKDKLLILQDRDSAFDIEYWTRCSDWLGQQRRELVDYSDLDAPEITDDMYVSNLVRQYPHLDPKLPVNVLERIIDAFRK